MKSMIITILTISKVSTTQWLPIQKVFQNLTIKDPEYIFRVPDSPLPIRVKKSEFLDPVYPNITRLKRKFSNVRRSGTNDYEIEWLENVDITSNSSDLNTKNGKLNMMEIYQENSTMMDKNTNDDWKLLGLDGWAGEIASPAEYIRQTRSRKKFVVKAKEVEAPANFSNADIYVARSNNPFGHSTKLQLKNSTIEPEENDPKKLKRNIYNLYSMLKCSTGCSPLNFKGYGCFCGFMGSGIAVDGIDYCCQMHDKCYGASNCIHYTEYFIPYVWKCYKGKPLCAYSHGEFGGPDSCAATLCKCDFQLAMCLRKFKCPEKRALCSNSSIRLLQNFIMNIL